MDYFRLFYEYFEEKVSDFLSVKSGSVIIFFLYNLVANFAREYESSHDSSYKCFGQGAYITRPGNNLDTMTIDHFTMYTIYCTKYFMSIISKQYCTIGENNNQMFL